VVHALPSYLVLAQRFIHKLFPSFLDFRPVGIPYVFFNIHILRSVFEVWPQTRAVNNQHVLQYVKPPHAFIIFELFISMFSPQIYRPFQSIVRTHQRCLVLFVRVNAHKTSNQHHGKLHNSPDK